MFLKLCAKFIPCEHEAYDLAVACLDVEVDLDLASVLDVHGPDAFPKGIPRPGKDGLPRTIQDIHTPAPDTEQADAERPTCPRKTTTSPWIPRTQVCLLVTPVVAKRTKLTLPSPPPHRWKQCVPKRER
jgi:hypothetical protein